MLLAAAQRGALTWIAYRKDQKLDTNLNRDAFERNFNLWGSTRSAKSPIWTSIGSLSRADEGLDPVSI